MDGVLANFDKKKEEVFGKGYVKDSNFWSTIHGNYSRWFAELEPMKDMKLLYDFCKSFNPIVLTAASRSNLYRITQQKIHWVHQHLGVEVPVIVCMRKHKKDYASKESCLIDDNEDNIKEFRLHGGQAILHKSAALTIAELVVTIDGAKGLNI